MRRPTEFAGATLLLSVAVFGLILAGAQAAAAAHRAADARTDRIGTADARAHRGGERGADPHR